MKTSDMTLEQRAGYEARLAQTLERCAAAAARILEESMIEAFALTFPGAPLGKVVEVKIGRTWKEVK